jgi:hypothetical protein
LRQVGAKRAREEGRREEMIEEVEGGKLEEMRLKAARRRSECTADLKKRGRRKECRQFLRGERNCS